MLFIQLACWGRDIYEPWLSRTVCLAAAKPRTGCTTSCLDGLVTFAESCSFCVRQPMSGVPCLHEPVHFLQTDLEGQMHF